MISRAPATVENTVARVSASLHLIRSRIVDTGRRFAFRYRAVPNTHRASAINLLHYIALRREDLRTLQADLMTLGLSSLGRAESGVLASVNTLIDLVSRLANGSPAVKSGTSQEADSPPIGLFEGRELLDRNARVLLGAPPASRDVRIMVTMPSEAADDYRLVRDLLGAGMDCMRINTAHDDASAWDRMLRHLDRAKEEIGRPCCVLMDLAGPKPRTGPIEPGPRVVKWKPRRDSYGHVVAPARIWLMSRGYRPPAASAAVCLTVDNAWLADLEIGDIVKFTDSSNSKRTLRIVARTDTGVLGESTQTAYVVPGTRLRRKRGTSSAAHAETVVGDLPAIPQSILLARGDVLVLSRRCIPGSPAVVGPCGEIIQPAVMSVTLPAVFDHVRPGEAIWFDDGKIGGVIGDITDDRVEVTITHARPGGARLGSGKGINLPDSSLRLPSLTPKDLEVLPLVAARADLVGYSFVQSEADVFELQSRLTAFGRSLGVILKIETRQAFEQLPGLLLAAMRSPAAGVMVARGDLAVECGFERLAEVQEEILWMAEASHVPVIWATQVMENLARKGIPSRAEVTDAAMGERAECVLLNKGPYILDAVRTLDGILTRMQTHQKKKSTMLRRLSLADRFLDESEHEREAPPPEPAE